jgi:hypothetical protein
LFVQVLEYKKLLLLLLLLLPCFSLLTILLKKDQFDWTALQSGYIREREEDFYQ